MLCSTAVRFSSILALECRLAQVFSSSTLTVAPSHELHTSATLSKKKRGIVYKNPLSFKWAWKASGIDLENSYTHEPLPYVKTGGRGPDGRKQYKHVGGGLKRPFFQVDFCRVGNKDGTPCEELVLDIRKTFWRNQFIALVAQGTSKRWIIACKGMTVNEIVRSYSEIPPITVSPKAGDSHPLGALPLGTVVSCVERQPGKGAKVAMSAGASAVLVRRHGDGNCVLKMPSKREMLVDEQCHAVVGQVSLRPTFNITGCGIKMLQIPFFLGYKLTACPVVQRLMRQTSFEFS